MQRPSAGLYLEQFFREACLSASRQTVVVVGVCEECKYLMWFWLPHSNRKLQGCKNFFVAVSFDSRGNRRKGGLMYLLPLVLSLSTLWTLVQVRHSSRLASLGERSTFLFWIC